MRGKSNRSKERARWDREVKAWFATLGITSCEAMFAGCMGRFGLALAHSKKRRFIQTRDDYFEVVAACQKCHERLDNVLTHEGMEALVKDLIQQRRIAA